MYIVSIIGKSNSGKTTLIERLIPELIKRDYKVATIKHDAHNFEVDKVGKDSWRHKNAGAQTTIVSSAKQIAIFTSAEKDNSLEYLCENYIKNVDIVLAEGYRISKYPKIVVNKPRDNLMLYEHIDNLLAIVGDGKYDYDVPVFHRNEISKIADIINQQNESKG